MDPIGFSFEQFDTLGAFNPGREKEPLTGAGNLTGDPLFANTGAGDFHPCGRQRAPVTAHANVLRGPAVALSSRLQREQPVGDRLSCAVGIDTRRQAAVGLCIPGRAADRLFQAPVVHTGMNQNTGAILGRN